MTDMQRIAESPEEIRQTIRERGRQMLGPGPEAALLDDPAVNLLIMGISHELHLLREHLREQLETTEYRMLMSLLPTETLGPVPASVILHGRPARPGSRILGSRFLSPQNVDFEPVVEPLLSEADVLVLLGNGFRSLRNPESGAWETSEAPGNGIPADQLWIGIREKDAVRSPQTGEPRKYPLYFWSESDSQPSWPTALCRSRWFARGGRVKARCGLDCAGLSPQHDGQLMFLVERYDRHFITLEEAPPHFQPGVNEGASTGSPAPTEPPLGGVTGIASVSCWINLVMAQPLPPATLRSLRCSLNCFPVLNLKTASEKRDKPASLERMPLQQGRHLFGLPIVRDGDGSVVPNIGVRTGEALRDRTTQCVDLLRRVAAYRQEELNTAHELGTLGKKRELGTLGEHIEDWLQTREDRRKHPETSRGRHLFLELPRDSGPVTISWQTTLGKLPEAQQPQPGDGFSIVESGGAELVGIRSVSPVINGQMPPSEDQLRLIVTGRLMSQERMVTQADIREQCRRFFGKAIDHQRTSIAMECIASPPDGGGMVPVSRVTLMPGGAGDAHPWPPPSERLRELELILQEKSPSGMKYSVACSDVGRRR